ncbi:MAG: GntR family transcriptional regulator [Alicyclobacillus sp.]|nr:GntR family transcriptional regulator [Alicyclobacillus sp.]
MELGNDATEFRFRTLSEGVENVVRRMILLGELVPGERINEVQLAEQLGMSRGPVREALRRLQSEGLVTYHAHRGTFVTELSDKDAEEVYKLRALLEVGAVRSGMNRVDAAVLGQLEEIVKRFEVAQSAKDVGEMIQADIAFHHTVVKLADNGRLLDLYKSLDTQVGAMFIAVQSKAPSRMARLAGMHQELIEALRSGDVTVACDALEQHYLSALHSLRRVNGTP